MQRRQCRNYGENCRKLRHGSWRKSETRKKWSMKQGLRAEKFILRHWWISVILRVLSWNLNIRNTKAESYSEDDSGSYAVFTEQGPSASQKTAPKAADAVSAYTQVKMEDASTLLKTQSQNVQIFGYRRTSGQNHGQTSKTQWFLSKGICTVILWQEYDGKGNLRKFYWNTVGTNKVWNCECSFVNRARGLFLSVYSDDIKLAGKTKNTEPTWKILMDDVDLGEPTSFLDHHVYLGCTQRECQISKDIVANYRYVRIQDFCWSQRETTDQSFRETWCRNNIFLVLWHGRSREEMCGKILRTCKWIKRLNNFSMSQHHAWMTINLKKKTMSQ